MKNFIKKINTLLDKPLFVIDVKNNLPKFSAWKHENAICLLPYLSIQWYKYQGVTSNGCIKFQINFGWILFSMGLMWCHKGQLINN